MSDHKPIVVILSGGMDSTTLLYHVVETYERNKIFALSIHYGQSHSRELEAAARTCQYLKIKQKILLLGNQLQDLLKGSSLTSSEIAMPEGNYAEDNMKLTVVPNRNMIFLSLAIGYVISLGGDTVYYGAHAGDHTIYPDCRPEFVKAINKVASLSHFYPIKIEAPYLNKTKAFIASEGKRIGVNYLDTWTCYKGGIKACGKCGSCVERLEAFDLADMRDPLEYEDRNYWKTVTKEVK